MKLFGFFSLPEPWTISHWQEAFADVTFHTALKNTVIIGIGTSIAAIVCYTVVAYCTVRGSTLFRGYIDLLAWLPATIPGVILGLGYLAMVLNVGLFSPLYGTVWLLVLVNFLSAITLGTQIIKVAMLQIGADVEEAGRAVGGSWFRTFRGILVPLSAPAIAVVAIMVFATSIRQVGAIVLLSTGQTRPLSILQLEFLASGILGPAAVVGVIIVGFCLAAGLSCAGSAHATASTPGPDGVRLGIKARPQAAPRTRSTMACASIVSGADASGHGRPDAPAPAAS